MVRWWEILEPVDAEIPCGGGRHRLRWAHGGLHLRDHDQDAEHTLTALGGPRPACLDLLRISRDDRALAALARRLQGGAGRSAATLDRVLLDALVEAPALLERLALAAVVAAGRRDGLDVPTRLTVDRVARAAVDRALVGVLARVDVRIHPARADAAPTAFGWANDDEATVYAVLPDQWLAVAAAGLAAVGGHLVLAVTGAAGPGFRALAATWDGGRDGRRELVERSVVVERTPVGGWRLR